MDSKFWSPEIFPASNILAVDGERQHFKQLIRLQEQTGGGEGPPPPSRGTEEEQLEEFESPVS